jgi:hypothetical protein
MPHLKSRISNMFRSPRCDQNPTPEKINVRENILEEIYVGPLAEARHCHTAAKFGLGQR